MRRIILLVFCSNIYKSVLSEFSSKFLGGIVLKERPSQVFHALAGFEYEIGVHRGCRWRRNSTLRPTTKRELFSRVANTIHYDLTVARRRILSAWATSKSLIYTVNGVIRSPEAIFSLPARGYNVFLGTLINSIHFAQRFLITYCTEP